MKTKKPFLKSAITIIALIFSINLSYGQFNPFPGATGLATVANNQVVTIGNFPNLASVHARLHVSNFLCAQPNGAFNGLLFRTDGNNNVDNMWQMFTGASATTTTEKGRLFTTNTAPSLNTDFNIKSTAGSLFLFSANTSANGYHVMIDNVHDYVGIGGFGVLPPPFPPISILPDMPLHILADNNNKLTASGWNAAIHLENHAAIVWDKDNGPNYFLIGCPSWTPQGDFYCGTAPGLTHASQDNYCYRIIGNPNPNSIPTNTSPFTPPNTDDIEFFSTPTIAQSHNVLVDGKIGVYLNDSNTVFPLYTPTNQVEINTIATNTSNPPTVPRILAPNTSTGYLVPNLYGGTGFSGLRFTDLRSGLTGSTPIPWANLPSNQGVLSIDQNGDVIYVTENGIGTCAKPTTFPAGANGAIDLQTNNHNFYYLGQGNTPFQTIPNWTSYATDIGIGYPCGTSLAGKISVLQNSPSFTYSSSLIYNYSIAGYFNDNFSLLPQGNTNLDVGVYSVAQGMQGIATQSNVGVYGLAQNGAFNYGIYGIAPAPTWPLSSNKNWAGFFNGAVAYGAAYTPSDSLIKTGNQPISNALGIINNLKPISFFFDTFKGNNVGVYLPDSKQYGFTAQEVERVLPELVTQATNPPQFDSIGSQVKPAYTFKVLNYNAFIGILTQGEKELDSAVTVLQNTTPPNVPILAYPADSAVNVPLTVTLSWTKSTRVSSYTVYINQANAAIASAGAKQATPYSITINTTDTFITVTLPNYITMYYWNVIAYNIAGSSNMSAQWYFTTMSPPVPVAPVLVSPVNSSTGLPLANTFTWNSSASASGYVLYISADTTYNNIVNSAKILGDTSVTLSVPKYNATFYWWVVTWNVNGQSASVKWNFTTLTPPPPAAPQLASPVFGDTVEVPIVSFQWHTSAGANLYALYVSTTPDKTGIVFNTTIADTFSSANLPYDTTYYWWVVACNQYSCGATSNVWSFFGQAPGKIVIQPKPLPPAQQAATLSDSTLKTDVSKLSNAMPLISQLNPVNFYWDTLKLKWLPKTPQIGLIAQQVDRIVPQVVFKDTAGYYNIQYGRLVALLIEGMKEMNAKNDSLNTRLTQLESIVQTCCSQNQNSKTTTPTSGQLGNSGTQSNVQYVELDMANTIILNQNDPNPFAEETDITYFLPETVGSATIMFYDNTGVIIKAVQLQSKGNGTLHVFASNLSSGMYTYALIVDGKLIDSKKMMKTK